MFFITYMLAELRRRSGRTVLTALGLAIGVGLVVAVNALSTGLDRAQAQVLEPLTGVGTDMSVSRPIDPSSSDERGFPDLSGGSGNSCGRRTVVGASVSETSASRGRRSHATTSSLQLSSRFPLARSQRFARSTE